MRVIVTMRGTAVVDLELCWPRRQEPGEEPPVLQAAAHLAGSEIAEPMEPDTSAFGFGR